MGTAAESVRISASLKEVWDRYFNPESWAVWVDGFSSVISSEGYPDPGGRLRWRSTPAGRGEVTEEVLEHEPRRFHRVGFSDPESAGDLETSFSIDGDEVVVAQKMTYDVLHSGILGPLTDVFFVRRQVAASLARSLAHLKRECEAEETGLG